MVVVPVNDTLDDILAGSDEEEESDALVTRVLDEIGIEVCNDIHEGDERCVESKHEEHHIVFRLESLYRPQLKVS